MNNLAAPPQIITVGYNPSAIAIKPDGNHVFVTNSNGVAVSVINVSTLAVIQTLPWVTIL